MSSYDLTAIFRDAIRTGFIIGGPILLVSIIVGLLISIIQAATSINEQTMTFVPKLLFIGLVLVISGGFMLQQLVDFLHRTFAIISNIG